MAEKTKRKRKQDSDYVALYKEVAKYVASQGGKVIMCGGIQVQEWPEDHKFSFTIAIKCVGKKPKFAE